LALVTEEAEEAVPRHLKQEVTVEYLAEVVALAEDTRLVPVAQAAPAAAAKYESGQF
jgi:hypothetical protein